MLGIIGGSSLDRLAALEGVRRSEVDTPYGPPSGPVLHGKLNRHAVAFLARHGEQHQLPPHKINYRANLWALKQQGVTWIVAVATVGGITADFSPGVLAVPDQIIDYTWGRASTYFEGAGSNGHADIRHIDFTQPFELSLRERLLKIGAEQGERLQAGGTYAATQGPRLETAAEIKRLARDGADVVGMTGMPEAALARELDLPYAMLAVVVNAAAGIGVSGLAIDLPAAEALARERMKRVVRLLEGMAADGN